MPHTKDAIATSPLRRLIELVSAWSRPEAWQKLYGTCVIIPRFGRRDGPRTTLEHYYERDELPADFAEMDTLVRKVAPEYLGDLPDPQRRIEDRLRLGFVQRMRFLLGVLMAKQDTLGATEQHAVTNGLVIVAGGFSLRGEVFPLTGRPLQMLSALLGTRHHRATANDLVKAMRVDDAASFPDQVIKDTAKKLRQALRDARLAKGLPALDPLPSTGRGADLTYCLEKTQQ